MNTKWAFTRVLIHTASFARMKKRENISKHSSPWNCIITSPSFLLAQWEPHPTSHLFILKCVSGTNEVNGITHMLRDKYVLCWIRATELSNMGWAVNMGCRKIPVLWPDIALLDSFRTKRVWLPISVYCFTLWLRFLLYYPWQVRPDYLLTYIT